MLHYHTTVPRSTRLFNSLCNSMRTSTLKISRSEYPNALWSTDIQDVPMLDYLTVGLCNIPARPSMHSQFTRVTDGGLWHERDMHMMHGALISIMKQRDLLV